LGIPYLDDYGQRRLVHSFRHTMISTCLAGWVGNRASWQRLQTSMQNAMNIFFTSGFGNSLTSAFDAISAAVNGSGGA
ncbi:hypothetical protein OFN48_35845, partial [Escherichia coli]|nr:hypothetical protein [Escherichia coli]